MGRLESNDNKNNPLTVFAALGELWSYRAGLGPGLGLYMPDSDLKDPR